MIYNWDEVAYEWKAVTEEELAVVEQENKEGWPTVGQATVDGVTMKIHRGGRHELAITIEIPEIK